MFPSYCVLSAACEAENAIQLCTCNSSDAQRWFTPGDNTIRVFGKCLDVSRGGTVNNTPAQRYDCNNTSAQKFRLG